jgi:hypothetical protein
VLGEYCFPPGRSVSFSLCFSQEIVSFCRHLERYQVRFEFAFQHNWINYIEMRRFLELKVMSYPSNFQKFKLKYL